MKSFCNLCDEKVQLFVGAPLRNIDSTHKYRAENFRIVDIQNIP